MNRIIVAGTDTGIGKTIFSAALTQALNGTYWKPVQSGLEDETDTEVVARLTGRPTLPEAIRLRLPASPHISADAEGITIDPAKIDIPRVNGPLIIEGAGGLMVPLNPQTLYLDLFAQWQIPIVLCARTALGTINHSLLSVRALKEAGCPIAGIAFIGDAEPQVENTITDFGLVSHLGRIPVLESISPQSLSNAASGIDTHTIIEAMS